MRFIIMHNTNAYWEAGALPGPELIARVGAMIGELAKAGALLGGEGLRPSAEGVRLKLTSGSRVVVPGPFVPGNELPAGFSIVRAESLEQVIEWASGIATVLGDEEIDIRPVTEPWDIGLRPKPPETTTRRYMVLRKATAASEAGESPLPAQRSQLSQVIEQTMRGTVHLLTEHMRPSARGRRYKNSRDGISMFDGPFIESKEMLGGYVIVSAESLEQVDPWARRYIDAVQPEEVDVRELDRTEPADSVTKRVVNVPDARATDLTQT